MVTRTREMYRELWVDFPEMLGDALSVAAPEVQARIWKAQDRMRDIIRAHKWLRDEIGELLTWKYAPKIFQRMMWRPASMAFAILLRRRIRLELTEVIAAVDGEDRRDRENWEQVLRRHPSFAAAAKIGLGDYDRSKAVRVDWETFQPRGD